MKLVDLPLTAGVGLYQRTIEKIAEGVRDFPVLSLYLQGGFSAPGVSDIDLIILHPDDDKCARMDALRLSSPAVHGLSECERALFTHSIAVMRRSELRDVRYLYGGANPKYVAGVDVDFCSDEDTKVSLNSLILGIEFLPLRWSELAALSVAEDLPVRKLLMLGHSVCHSIGVASKFASRERGWSSYEKASARFRGLQSSHEFNSAELQAFLMRSERVVRELMLAFEVELLKRVAVGADAPVVDPGWFLNHRRRVTLSLIHISEPTRPY